MTRLILQWLHSSEGRFMYVKVNSNVDILMRFNSIQNIFRNICDNLRKIRVDILC